MNTPSPTQSASQTTDPPVVLIEDSITTPDAADEQDEEVRRLAESLAPQVQELDELLTSPQPLLDSARGSRASFSFHEDEDDDMKSEEKRLEASEELLRQELEFAQDWSQLMASPLRDENIARELAVHCGVEEDEDQLTEPEEEEDVPPQAYTIDSHAEMLGVHVDGGWYVLESKLAPDVHEYVVPLPIEQLKRLYIGLVGNQGEATPVVDATVDHEEESSASHAGVTSPAPHTPLRTPASSKSRSSIVNRHEPLPVRTVVIWIRPDVLCGAVMDAIYHAMDGIGEVTKRQGGVLKGVVHPCVMTNTETGHVTHCPGYVVDVQLCTYKGTARNKKGQRSLIMRVYHYFPGEDVLEEDNHDNEEQSVSCETNDESHNALLKEAAALVQKMETGSTDITKRSSFVSMFSPRFSQGQEQNLPQVVSQQLLLSYRACPSVLDGRLTLPALSEQDAPVIHASWRWIDVCWNELENRDLCYRYVSRVVSRRCFPRSCRQD